MNQYTVVLRDKDGNLLGMMHVYDTELVIVGTLKLEKYDRVNSKGEKKNF